MRLRRRRLERCGLVRLRRRRAPPGPIHRRIAARDLLRRRRLHVVLLCRRRRLHVVLLRRRRELLERRVLLRRRLVVGGLGLAEGLRRLRCAPAAAATGAAARLRCPARTGETG